MASFLPEGSTHYELHNFGIVGAILCFIGGCIGAITLNGDLHVLQIANHTDLMDDFIIRSLIGGVIGLCVKVVGDLLVHWIKTRKQRKG